MQSMHQSTAENGVMIEVYMDCIKKLLDKDSKIVLGTDEGLKLISAYHEFLGKEIVRT